MTTTVHFEYKGSDYCVELDASGHTRVYHVTCKGSKFAVCSGQWDPTLPGFAMTDPGYYVDPLFLVALEGAVFSAAGFTQSYVVEQSARSAAFYAAVN